jgi:hypothetical protein
MYVTLSTIGAGAVGGGDAVGGVTTESYQFGSLNR